MRIKSKITLIFVFFVLLLLFILWLFQTFFLDSFYQSIKAHNTRSSTLAVANNIDHADLQTLIEQLQYEENVNIQIFDRDGHELSASSQYPHPSLRIPPQIFFSLLKKLEDASQKPLSEIIQMENLRQHKYRSEFFIGEVPPPPKNQIRVSCCIMRVLNQAGEERIILSTAPISPIDAISETLQVQLCCIAIILLLCSLLLAHLFSRQIAEPIIRINESARQLAKRQYDTSFHRSEYLEIAELSDTLHDAAQELGKIDKLQQELIANVSHDLRTPLTMIKGYSEIMRDIPGENTPENVQTIIDETVRLSSLVNDLLDLSRLQAGSMELNTTRFNLTQSIRDILTRYVKLVEQEHYLITFEADEDVFVQADELKISQVVYNLINNAVNYTGSDKTILVQQLLRKNCVRIAVHDTGEGIPPDQIPFIWQRYYRIDKTHKRAAIGTGLGLSIVQNVMELHHARYGIDSSEKNGSVFWFELDTIPNPKA